MNNPFEENILKAFQVGLKAINVTFTDEEARKTVLYDVYRKAWLAGSLHMLQEVYAEIVKACTNIRLPFDSDVGRELRRIFDEAFEAAKQRVKA